MLDETTNEAQILQHMETNKLLEAQILQNKEMGTVLEAVASAIASKAVQKVELKGAEIVTIKGERGERGEKGDPGKDGKSIVGPQGPKGDSVIGPPGPRGERGEKGDKPIAGVDFALPRDGKPGKNGKDGSPDSPEQVRDKLRSLKKGQRLSLKDLDDTEWMDRVGSGVADPTYTVKVDSEDIPGFLEDKIAAGSNVTITESTVNGRKVLTIAATGGGGGGGGYSVVSQSSATLTLTDTDGEKVISCDCTANAITITLPTAVGNTAKFHIKKVDTGTNAVTVDGAGSETIDGETTQVIDFAWSSMTIVSDNANWLIL